MVCNAQVHRGAVVHQQKQTQGSFAVYRGSFERRPSVKSKRVCAFLRQSGENGCSSGVRQSSFHMKTNDALCRAKSLPLHPSRTKHAESGQGCSNNPPCLQTNRLKFHAREGKATSHWPDQNGENRTEPKKYLPLEVWYVIENTAAPPCREVWISNAG